MAALAVQVEGGFWSYRWFVYITTLLLQEASWVVYCFVGHLNPASVPSSLLVLLEPHLILKNEPPFLVTLNEWVWLIVTR